jgi:hypothetical protein
LGDIQNVISIAYSGIVNQYRGCTKVWADSFSGVVNSIPRGNVAAIIADQIPLIYKSRLVFMFSRDMRSGPTRHTVLQCIGQGLDVQNGNSDAIRHESTHHQGAYTVRASSDYSNFFLPLPDALVTAPHPPVLSPEVEERIQLE